MIIIDLIHLSVDKTYKRLLRRLCEQAGFRHHQYSDYYREDVTAIQAFWVMVRLRRIAPRSKLATTLKGLKMHHIPDWNICDQTREVQLGGFYSRVLQGPAPARLVDNLNNARLAEGLPAVPVAGIIQPPPFVRPVDTQGSDEANDPNNWVQ
jgi:hypothetical protein